MTYEKGECKTKTPILFKNRNKGDSGKELILKKAGILVSLFFFLSSFLAFSFLKREITLPLN